MNNNVLIVGIKEQLTPLEIGMLIDDSGLLEYCLDAKLMANGIEGLLVGHVGREFLSFRATFENKLVEIVKLFESSRNRQERRVAISRKGVFLCKLININ